MGRSNVPASAYFVLGLFVCLFGWWVISAGIQLNSDVGVLLGYFIIFAGVLIMGYGLWKVITNRFT